MQGLETWRDCLGNVRGSLAPSASHADEPALVLGSHFDTVRDGGKYDGALGVVAAISAVKAVAQAGTFSRPLQVVAFSDEEGYATAPHAERGPTTPVTLMRSATERYQRQIAA